MERLNLTVYVYIYIMLVLSHQETVGHQKNATSVRLVCRDFPPVPYMHLASHTGSRVPS